MWGLRLSQQKLDQLVILGHLLIQEGTVAGHNFQLHKAAHTLAMAVGMVAMVEVAVALAALVDILVTVAAPAWQVVGAVAVAAVLGVSIFAPQIAS